MSRLLITGGTGYIGSHSAVVLSKLGHQVVLYDNLSNSTDSILEKLIQITGQRIHFIRGAVRDTGLLKNTLATHCINAVVHFAGLKAVGESVEKPVEYYANNVQGTIGLLQAMQSVQVKTLVFSSSAAVYVQAFEKASGCRVPCQIVARRAGDVAACYANPNKASECLSWRAMRSLDDMCASTWRFHQSQRSGLTS